MNKEKTSWCASQKKGIELIDIKPHLSKAYMLEADDTVDNMMNTKGKWKLITAYYACYNALYSLLMKTGIKCEIHDCTIELMGYYSFSDDDIALIMDLKDDRINAQYYLKDVKLKDEKPIKAFVSKCKEVLETLDDTKIEKIREELKLIITRCKK